MREPTSALVDHVASPVNSAAARPCPGSAGTGRHPGATGACRSRTYDPRPPPWPTPLRTDWFKLPSDHPLQDERLAAVGPGRSLVPATPRQKPALGAPLW